LFSLIAVHVALRADAIHRISWQSAPAQPVLPPIPGLEKVGYLTSTTAMEPAGVPDTLIVVGANAVGLEMAQLFARDGVSPTRKWPPPD
jgi:mercuric reductase